MKRQATPARAVAARRTGFTLLELLVVATIIGLLAALLLPALSGALASGRQAACLSNLRQLYLANATYATGHGSYAPAAPDIWGDNLIRWYGTRPDPDTPFDSRTGPLSPYLGENRAVRACASMSRWNFVSDPPEAYEAGCGGYGYNYLGVGTRSYQFGYNEAAGQQGMRPEDLTRASTTLMFCDTAFPQYISGQTRLIEYSFAEPDQFMNATGTLYGQPSPSIHFRHRQRASLVWGDGHAGAETMTRSKGSAAQNLLVGWFGDQTNNFYFAPF